MTTNLKAERKVSIQLNDINAERIVPGDSEANGEISFSTTQLRPKKPLRTAPAVRIKNACKSYIPGKPILDKLDMTVQKGTIYGLLGSSGCGKTTALSCIVGLKELDSGSILVFGSKPGTKGSGIPGRRLGYMPQEIALYTNLTIMEILQYFGRIFGMTSSEIEDEAEFLINFLHLPNRYRSISTLSGGQQRRVSLAASLIHDPDLLILDEPTVGMDPLLRESIWNHLYDLVTQRQTSVIITTHYIEEARHSHTVGILRNGRLLAEKAPQALITEHNANLLEDIVLKLCKNDVPLSSDSDGVQKGDRPGKIGGRLSDVVREALSEISFYSRPNRLLPLSRTHETAEVISEAGPDVVGLKFKRMTTAIGDRELNSIPVRGTSLRRSHRPSTMYRKNSYIDALSEDLWFRVSRIQALTIRNYLNFIRNPIFVLGIILIPTIQMVLTALIVGSDPQYMRLGVINNEHLDWEDFCPKVDVSACNENLSCKYLNLLKYHTDGSFDLVSIKNEADGVKRVQRGDMWGFMSIPANYSEHISLRYGTGINAENETLDGSIISLRLDFSHYVAARFLTSNLYSAFQDYLKKSLTDCYSDADTREMEIPITYLPVYGNKDSQFFYLEYIIPGALLLILYLITLCSCAISVITDRKQGTLDRSRVAGIQSSDTMISYFISEGTTVLFQVALGAMVLMFGFNLNVHGSVILFLFVCTMAGLCGQASGLLVGLFCADEVEALFLCSFFYLPMMLLAGVIWPLEAMHIALRYFSYCLPLTLTCESLRSITNRGVGISHSSVYPGVIIVFVWTTFFWIVALFMLKSKSSKK